MFTHDGGSRLQRRAQVAHKQLERARAAKELRLQRRNLVVAFRLATPFHFRASEASERFEALEAPEAACR